MSPVILLCILALISGTAYIEMYLEKVIGFRVPIISDLPRWMQEGVQANFGLIFLLQVKLLGVFVYLPVFVVPLMRFRERASGTRQESPYIFSILVGNLLTQAQQWADLCWRYWQASLN